jgi:hypothetical protein
MPSEEEGSSMSTSTTPGIAREEAIRLLLRNGVTPDDTLPERLAAAAGRMAAHLDRLPRDLPAGLEPAAAFSVPRP